VNRFINFIGTVVLCGILLKLSYVFVYLFGELDGSSLMSRTTGVTFAFASIYFVVKVRRNWLKLVMVVLDVCTILYFYLHERMSIPIDFASVIVAAYSGLIIFYLGRTVSDRLSIDAQSTAGRQPVDCANWRIDSRSLSNAGNWKRRLHAAGGAPGKAVPTKHAGSTNSSWRKWKKNLNS
jgi:hypothetical protein